MRDYLGHHKGLVEYLLLAAGTAWMAFGVQCIYEPTGFVTGGFTGLAIITKEMTQGVVPGGIPIWATNLVLNIPLFLAAYKVKGRGFLGRAFCGMVLHSFWLYVIPETDLVGGDFVLAAIFGGVSEGIGVGLVLLAKATTGGVDMLASLLHGHFRQYSIVQLMQFLDGIIVLLGMCVFGIPAALYAVVAVFIMSKVSDALMEGLQFSKAACIITDRYEEVANRILRELKRGVTGLSARGMYSGHEKCMLYCVVSKKEIVQVKEIVAKTDPSAFVIVSDAREVLGEGFLEKEESA